MQEDEGKGRHFSPAPQSDAEAANSANPDTDPHPYGDDPEHEAYVLATDPDYYYSVMHPELGEWCDDEDEDEEGARDAEF